MNTLRLTATATIDLEAAPGKAPARTIRGTAVPWNVTATVSGGQRVKFLPGSLPVEGRAPKLVAYHDLAKPLGVVTARRQTDAGMEYEARISQTVAGDEALVLAADGVLDSVSVGVNPVEYHFEGDTLVVSKGEWVELSLVPVGAFAGASVDQVTATAPASPTDPKEPSVDPITTPPVAPATPGAENTPPAIAAAPGAALPSLPEPILAGMLQAAAAAIPRPQADARIITPGEYLAARFRGGAEWAAIRAANQVTDDTEGLLPTPIVGAVYDSLRARRPIIDSIGVLPMPGAGRTFTRPKVVQHTNVGAQGDELETLASRKMIVDPLTVTKATYGGTVTLSEQDVDWTDPSALNLVIADLAKMYAVQTEAAAAAALTAAASVTVPVVHWDDPDDVLGAIWDASILVAGTDDEADFATTIWASPDRCKTLGLLKSGDQYLFPNLNPMNGMGAISPVAPGNGEAVGLRVIRCGKLAEGTMIVGGGAGLELYEQRKGAIQVSDPSTLGVVVAWRGYFTSLAIDSARFAALITD